MTEFIIFITSLAALIAAAVVGATTKNERTRAWATGVTATAAVILIGVTALGLWQAWAPWELTKK